MTDKIEFKTVNWLVLILPVSIAIIVLFALWPLLLVLAVFSLGLNIWQRDQWQKLSYTVNPIFNQLVQENRGCVTPLDLAMKADFSAEKAKRFLDAKAEEFGAQRRNQEYYFITASSLGSIFDDSEPDEEPQHAATSVVDPLPTETTVEYKVLVEPTPADAEALIQAELAKRLNVHSSTVYKQRANPDFPEWSRTRDPEGIAWRYIPSTTKFEPLSNLQPQ